MAGRVNTVTKDYVVDDRSLIEEEDVAAVTMLDAMDDGVAFGGVEGLGAKRVMNDADFKGNWERVTVYYLYK